MTKKFITLIMAVLLPLSAFQMSADEKEARPIPIKKSLVNNMTMTNFSTTGEVAGEVLKIGWSDGASQTSSKTVKFTESYQQEDDEFGNFPVLFSDKVILSQSGSNATIKTYSTGYIDAMIIPHYE